MAGVSMHMIDSAAIATPVNPPFEYISFECSPLRHAGATLIAAPRSPSGEHREETRPGDASEEEGESVRFWMKARIRVDAKFEAIHNLATTLGNVADITQMHYLLHSEE